MHAFVLVALICVTLPPGQWLPCEEAVVRASSCEAAEAHLRNGAPSHHTIRVVSCYRSDS